MNEQSHATSAEVTQLRSDPAPQADMGGTHTDPAPYYTESKGSSFGFLTALAVLASLAAIGYYLAVSGAPQEVATVAAPVELTTTPEPTIVEETAPVANTAPAVEALPAETAELPAQEDVSVQQ